MHWLWWKAFLKRGIGKLFSQTHVYTLIVIGNACLYIDCGWEMLFFLVCGSVGFLGSTCFPLLSKHAYHGSQKLLMDCMSHSVPQSRWRKEQICVYLQNEKINSMRPCFPWALFFFFTLQESLRFENMWTQQCHMRLQETRTHFVEFVQKKRQLNTRGHCLNEACFEGMGLA